MTDYSFGDIVLKKQTKGAFPFSFPSDFIDALILKQQVKGTDNTA